MAALLSTGARGPGRPSFHVMHRYVLGRPPWTLLRAREQSLRIEVSFASRLLVL
jgi:hypothetical protein